MSVAALEAFEVTAGADDVAAFCRAAGLEATVDRLPFTYPIRWMAAPHVRAALAGMVPEPDIVPFHESQSFDYVAPLRVGVRYTLAVTARRESGPDRLVAEGHVAAEGGAVLATVETVLRLFSTRTA